MPKKDVAVIQLRIATRERLKEIGKKEESYDDIINRILDDRNNSGHAPLTTEVASIRYPCAPRSS
jgi:hypothetical protein